MTTAGFVPDTSAGSTPSGWSRVAASSSLLLGGVLVAGLPDVLAAATYLVVLASATALVAVVAGYALWARATLLARSGALLAAASVLVSQLVQGLLALPGVAAPERLTPLELGIPLATAAAVLVFLAADAVGRKPEPVPDRPYAL